MTTERYTVEPIGFWFEVFRVTSAGRQWVAALDDRKDAEDLAAFLAERMQAAA